jgi:hypothetical protein
MHRPFFVAQFTNEHIFTQIGAVAHDENVASALATLPARLC